MASSNPPLVVALLVAVFMTADRVFAEDEPKCAFPPVTTAAQAECLAVARLEESFSKTRIEKVEPHEGGAVITLRDQERWWAGLRTHARGEEKAWVVTFSEPGGSPTRTVTINRTTGLITRSAR